MNILALDIATKTGVAFGRAGETPRGYTIDLRKAASGPDRFAKIIQATNSLVRRLRPDLVVYEAPIGGKVMVIMPAQLAACVAGQARLLGARVEDVPVMTVRKHFLGKNLTKKDFPGLNDGEARAAIKQSVINRCFALGWRPVGDDQADAMALWDFAQATWGRVQARPVGGLFDERG